MFEDHTIVVIRNYGPMPYRTGWGGNFYVAPAAQRTGDGQVVPGQVSLPWVIARRDFGDPFLVDLDPTDPYRRFRTNDLSRLNGLYGMLDGSFYEHRPAVTKEPLGKDAVDPQPYIPLDDDVVTAGYTPHPAYRSMFRHPNLPLIEVWTTDAIPERVYMLIDDPEGDAARERDAAATNRAQAQLHDDRVEALERQLAELRAQMGSSSAVAEEADGEIPADDGIVIPGVSMDDVRPEAPEAVDVATLESTEITDVFSAEAKPKAAKANPKR